MTALVRSFAALRPTAESAAEVIAPPYDVVSTEEARALAAGRPRSFLHISRPEIDLPEGSSPYSDAAYEQVARSLERHDFRRLRHRSGELLGAPDGRRLIETTRDDPRRRRVA